MAHENRPPKPVVSRVSLTRARAQLPTATVAARPRAAVARGDRIALVPTVLDPFQDVAVHVAQPKGVRRVRADRGGPAHFPAKVGLLERRRLVAPRVARRRPRPTGVFPLRLGRQSVRLAGLPAQLFDVRHGILPAHTHHGMLIGLLEPGGAPIGARALLPFAISPDPTTATHVVRGRLDEPRKLTPGHGVLADCKRLRDRDPMLRLLAVDPFPLCALSDRPAALGLGRGHHEVACGHRHQLRAPRRVAQHGTRDPASFPSARRGHARSRRQAGQGQPPATDRPTGCPAGSAPGRGSPDRVHRSRRAGSGSGRSSPAAVPRRPRAPV